MKILLTHRYFVPDSSPYGLILRQIGEELAAAGYEVQIFSSKPSYGKDVPYAPAHQKLGKLSVRRVWVLSEAFRNPLIRGVNVLIYCIALFFHVLRARADVVTAGTFPPVLAAWSASLAARLSGAHFVYHVQDIHPEVSTYSGGWLGRGIPAGILRKLDSQTLRRADAIVTLSEDMVETLRARGLRSLPIKVINNPPLEADGTAVNPPPELEKTEGEVRVIFAGNLGRFQNLPLLAEGVALCFKTHPELELMFLGDGVVLPELKERFEGCPQVRFAPFLPFAQARGLIAEADVGLVSLSPNIYKVAYPSKIATYQELGLRILALVEAESQLARDLERRGEGAVPAAATPSAIAVALERLIAAPMPTPNSLHDQRTSTSWEEIVSALRSNRR